MFETIASTNALLDGLVISNRYEVIRCLGTGAMGSVHLARDRFLSGNIVAIKALKKEIAEDPKMKKRFLQEVKLMHRVNHHNVVRTYDVGVDHDLIYFTMEYVKGETIEELINPNGIDLDLFYDIATQITAGLDEIHKAEIIHRDLKPGNVLLVDGRVKIADFGVARSSRSELTQHKEIIGSTPYIAPEIWTGEKLSIKADFYSLGVIFYELLVGNPPFEHELPATIMWMHLKKTAEEPKAIRAEIPQWLNSLVLKMLAKDPEDRPKSSEEIYRYLKNRTVNKNSSLKNAVRVGLAENQKTKGRNVTKHSAILKSLASTSTIINQQEDLMREVANSKNYFNPEKNKREKKDYAKYLYLIFFVLLSFFIYENKDYLKLIAKDSIELITVKEKKVNVISEKPHVFQRVNSLVSKFDEASNLKGVKKYKFNNSWFKREFSKLENKKITVVDRDNSAELLELIREKTELEAILKVISSKNKTQSRVELQREHKSLSSEINGYSDYIFSVQAKNDYWLNSLDLVERDSYLSLAKGYARNKWKEAFDSKKANKEWINYLNNEALGSKIKSNVEQIVLKNLKNHTTSLYNNIYLLEKAKLKLEILQQEINIYRKYSLKKPEKTYKEIKSRLTVIKDQLSAMEDINQVMAIKALELML